MRRFSWCHTALPVLLTIGILGGAQRDASWASTHTGRVGAGAAVTLSVYTCCGSLSGFAAKDNGLTDMHTLYARLWAHMSPSVGWQETSFTDQATLETRLASAVEAGAPPDAVFIQGGDIGSMVLRGLVQPLDRYVARYHGAESNFLPGMARWAHFGGHWWAIPAVSGPLGGQQIYLPKYMAPLGFNNGNLHTFDDYYAMSEKAVRFDAEGRLTRIGYWPGADSWETTGTLMCSPGHGLYNADNQPTATDLCNVTYLGYLKKLADLYGGYAKLRTFLSGDPDPNFSRGDPKAYIATGKALIAPGAASFWNISPLDANSFGVKGGLSYQLTTLPPTLHGTQAEVATYPSTLQEVIIPRGARHPDTAFAVSKMMFWDHGDLLGRSLSGAPVAQTGEQQHWLGEAISGEAAVRRQAGLPGNPVAGLVGIKMQPQLGQVSRASNPTNPVDPYYQGQLLAETARVLDGQESPQDALAQVQRRVLAQERSLQAQHGNWIVFAPPSSPVAPGTGVYRATVGPGGLETWSGSSEWAHAADGTLSNDGSHADSLILAPYDLGRIADYEVDAQMKVTPTRCPLGFGIVVRWARGTGLYSSADCHNGPAELWAGPLRGARRIAGRAFAMGVGWLTYRLRVEGATVSYAVDDGGRTLASMRVTDGGVLANRGGQIGLWTHHDQFAVRDVTVTALP